MDDTLTGAIEPTLAHGSWRLLACLVAALAPGVHAQSAATPPPPPTQLAANPAPAEQSAFSAADAAYRAFEQRQFDTAAELAKRASELAPTNVEYARLLMLALSSAGHAKEAEEAANRVIALAPSDPVALTERGRLRIARGDAAAGRADYEAALQSPQATPVQRVTALADLGRLDEARREFGALAAQPATSSASAPSDVELAYLADRLGEHDVALSLFRKADAAGHLPDAALRDAGFAAVRAGDNAQAAQWFGRANQAAAAGRLPLSAQALYDTRRSMDELTRQWGVFASLNYRRGGGITPGFGSVGSRIGSSWQAGAEAWWRPFGQHNARYVEAFARTFEAVDAETGPTGSDSRQIGLGARVKPFTSENLVLSVSRTDTRHERADWLMQAGYSRDWGTDFRFDRSAWGTVRVAAEAGRYVHRDQNYALGSIQAGRSFALRAGDSPTVVFPHAVLVGEYDSLATRTNSSGAGVGVTLRQWFRGAGDAAARSYVDLTLQYRAHLSGDERTKGLFFTALLSL